jgi:uncharacterized protein
MRSRIWLCPALVPLLFIAACGTSPPPRLYVLGDPAQPTQAMDVQSGRPVIQLLPVSVPDYLDTREILRRDGRNEVTPSPTGLWAERLSVGTSHALAAALATDLPNAVIVTDPPRASPSRQIMVDVLAFDIGGDGRCLLTARWTVMSGDGGRLLHRESDNFVEEAAQSTDPNIAAAMTRAIDRLAHQIAAVSRNDRLADARTTVGQVAEETETASFAGQTR